MGSGLTDACSVCGQSFMFALPRCPICRKSVCDGCAVRMGGSTFSSTECAHAFFFGGEDEVPGNGEGASDADYDEGE
jgi:hypothetical protein